MDKDLSQRLEQEYQSAVNTPSDINQHLPTLKLLADRCHSVTEFGVRTGVSTRAFLASQAQNIHLYDLNIDAGVQQLVSFCNSKNRSVTYQSANTLELDIEPTDLLFIDTLHTYNQLLAELNRHSSKVKKYIVFHDTFTFGCRDEGTWGGPGLLTALIAWLANNHQWQIVYHTHNNNGLTVVERKNSAIQLQGP